MNNIIKSNFTSLNGLNNETIDSLISDSVTTKTLLVNGESILPTQSTTIDSVNLNQLVPSASSYCTDTVTTINNVQHHVLTLGINRGIGAYLNVQSSIATLNPNQSPYCNTTTTIDSNGDYHYSLAFNLPASATQNFSVVGTNTISYGTNASVTLTSTVDSSGNKNNNFTFNIPQGQQGNTGALTIGTTTTVLPNIPASVTNTGTSTNAILNFSIPKGEKGDKGDTGDSNAGLAILIGALSGAAAAVLSQILNSILQGLMDIFGNVPEATEQDQIQSLADLISQMKAEIDQLQAEMDTVQSEVDVLQSQMVVQQDKTYYQTVGVGLYNFFPENYTKINSSLYVGTNGIFDKAPIIHTDGNIQCTKITPNQNNQLVVDGNLYVKGAVYSISNGNRIVNGGVWQW